MGGSEKVERSVLPRVRWQGCAGKGALARVRWQGCAGSRAEERFAARRINGYGAAGKKNSLILGSEVEVEFGADRFIDFKCNVHEEESARVIGDAEP